MTENNDHAIFVDAHVHIYDCFDLDLFFDSALLNFQKHLDSYRNRVRNCSFFLLLSEGFHYNWFKRLSNNAEKTFNSLNRWKICRTGERITLTVHQTISSAHKIYLIAGKQIVTEENLEVLALFTDQLIEDGSPLSDTVSRVKECGGIPVVPWGTGKWLGRRGKILKNFLTKCAKGDIFLGDNGGRPIFWMTPSLFHFAQKREIALLPGSDPLPFSYEVTKPGSYGFAIHDELEYQKPAQELRNLIQETGLLVDFLGNHETPGRFFRNQLAMQIAKRRIRQS